jgi:hypothetical protein
MQIHAFLLHQKQGYNTTQGTGENLQQRSSAADASVARLLNRLSSSCLPADLLCAYWSLTRAELESAASSTDKHYNTNRLTTHFSLFSVSR